MYEVCTILFDMHRAKLILTDHDDDDNDDNNKGSISCAYCSSDMSETTQKRMGSVKQICSAVGIGAIEATS